MSSRGGQAGGLGEVLSVKCWLSPIVSVSYIDDDDDSKVLVGRAQNGVIAATQFMARQSDVGPAL